MRITDLIIGSNGQIFWRRGVKGEEGVKGIFLIITGIKRGLKGGKN